MPARYLVQVDWNNDGNFTTAGDDVTRRVLDARGAVTVSYGRDQARSFSPPGIGEASFELDNRSRDYSPDNASSPLAGKVLPGRPVRIQAVFQGVTTTLFQGKLDDLQNKIGYSERSMSATAIDALGALNTAKVTLGVTQGIQPGIAMAVILDKIGWPDDLRDLDIGATVMPFWWLDKTPIFDAFIDLVSSEGPPALVTMDSAGRIVFRGRHHRLQRAASLTPQAVWRSGGSIEPVYSEPTTYNNGFKEIVNVVEFDVPTLKRNNERSVVWTADGDIMIDDDRRNIYITATGPFMDASVPVAGLDYEAVYGNPVMTLDRNSGTSVILTIDPNGTPCYIKGLQLRGYGIQDVDTRRVVLEDTNSINTFGRKSMADGQVPKWAGIYDATAIARILLAQRGRRVTQLQITMSGGVNARLNQQLNRDLSDRVTVIDKQSGLSGDCYIEQIKHSIDQGGLHHETEFGVEVVPGQIASVFILGSATNGVLGTNRLGRRGLMDPANVFILGSPSNGVLGKGVLAL
jgi:hypothetical protein